MYVLKTEIITLAMEIKSTSKEKNLSSKEVGDPRLLIMGIPCTNRCSAIKLT